jgi:hypothetical protein
MTEEAEAFEGWAILELMGHRRLAGWVSEQTLAGTTFIRLDIPAGEEETPHALYDPSEQSYAVTQFYSPAALYCLTPTTKDMALAVAKHNHPTPVQRWELPPARPEDTPMPGYVMDELSDLDE